MPLLHELDRDTIFAYIKFTVAKLAQGFTAPTLLN